MRTQLATYYLTLIIQPERCTCRPVTWLWVVPLAVAAFQFKVVTTQSWNNGILQFAYKQERHSFVQTQLHIRLQLILGPLPPLLRKAGSAFALRLGSREDVLAQRSEAAPGENWV